MSSYVKVGQENSTPIEVYYEDHGSGSPVILIHGWPLSGASWEKQTAALLAAGHRVITYDRRGFGRSSKPTVGYNYDTFAADLDAVLSTLNLTDVALVGFSMGTGEVTRYIGKYGTKRVRKAVLIGTLGPYLVKTPDNPEGVDRSVFEGVKGGIKADRPALLMDFLHNFYNYDVTGGKLVSERVLEENWNVAVGASATGTLACVDTWIEDFRQSHPAGRSYIQKTSEDDQERQVGGGQRWSSWPAMDPCGADQLRAGEVSSVARALTTCGLSAAFARRWHAHSHSPGCSAPAFDTLPALASSRAAAALHVCM